MKPSLKCTFAATAALLLGACGQTPTPETFNGSTSTVQLNLTFPKQVSGQQLRTQGVPSTVDRVVVKVSADGQQLQFDKDGNLVKSGGGDLVYTAATKSATLTLPVDLDYTFDFSAQNSTKNNVEVAWAANSITLSRDGATIFPQFKTIIDKVELVKINTTTISSNKTYGVSLVVTAPDGSTVSASDYGASYTLDSNTDASIRAFSAKGVLVDLGTVDTTVSATVSGLDADHKVRQFDPAETIFQIGASGVGLDLDVIAPSIDRSKFEAQYKENGSVSGITVDGQDDSNGPVTTIALYKGVEAVGGYTDSREFGSNFSFLVPIAATSSVMPGDTLTVYAYDAVGNESEPVTYIVPEPPNLVFNPAP